MKNAKQIAIYVCGLITGALMGVLLVGILTDFYNDGAANACKDAIGMKCELKWVPATADTPTSVGE